MNDLAKLQAELSKKFGRLTKWRLRCKEHNVTSEVDMIRLAQEVLNEPCTGGVVEAYGYQRQLQGIKPIPAPPYKS